MQPLGRVLAVSPQQAADPPGSAPAADNLLRHPEDRPAGETAEEFVVQGDDRLAATGVALAPGPPEQLPVDAAGLVVLSQDYVQAAGFPDGRV